jgi:hypothetical protein
MANDPQENVDVTADDEISDDVLEIVSGGSGTGPEDLAAGIL